VTKVAIQHRPGQTVELTVNGQRADPLSFDGVSVNSANTVAMSAGAPWNSSMARTDAGACARKDGSEAWRGERSVHFGGGPVRAEIDKAASKLMADGRTRPRSRACSTIRQAGARRNDRGFQRRLAVPIVVGSRAPDENQILSNGPREPQVEVQPGGLALMSSSQPP
jgi:hypothetical protein